MMSSALQMLLVLSANWHAIDGTLYCYERQSTSHPWNLVRPPIEVNLGRAGMAWGISEDDTLCYKREGDGKSPAGCFGLGPIFGDADHQKHAINMPFLLITEDLECIDDPSSSYYNRFIQTDSFPKKDWKSSEKMAQIGPIYALGIVVQHNMHPTLPHLGSAIFLHIWQRKGEGSAGCTIMDKQHLIQICSWLDEKKHPCLVQLPYAEYQRKQKIWHLPEI